MEDRDENLFNGELRSRKKKTNKVRESGREKLSLDAYIPSLSFDGKLPMREVSIARMSCAKVVLNT